jgi:excisionase family DNA binding protein
LHCARLHDINESRYAVSQRSPGNRHDLVAERLGVSLKTVWRLIEQQKLDALVAAPKLYFIPQQSLDRYLERNAAGEKQ